MNTLHQELDDFRRMTDGKVIQGSSHTCRVLNHKVRNKAIIKAVCDLRNIINEFDSIACCGISGLMVVPQIAEILNKHIIIVRKPEQSYSNFVMEGVVPVRYIVIDDLICSGETLNHITNTINEECPKSKCIGLYCYMPEECTYTAQTSKVFEKKYNMSLLNPYALKT
jgi:adenine/guanine phosphoribosyltransferase-like PRPP-binding protein